jgi:hypothetical protein
MTNPKESGGRTEVRPHNTIGMAMEDLPEADEGAQEGTLGGDGWGEEEEAHVFPKNTHGVIRKTVSAITTTTTTTSMVTPNLTLEEFVKFIDVVVASKYKNDLMNFTHTITEEVHSIIDTFKTDLQNMLPWQIRLVVQQVQGESQDKQPVVEPSTPYPGSTSAPGNTITLYSGNTTAPGNPGNIASTTTLDLGDTSGNVIYIDASSPYLGSVLMGNPGSFLTANLPYPGGTSTLGNPRFPAHTTLTNPNPNFQQGYCYTTKCDTVEDGWQNVHRRVTRAGKEVNPGNVGRNG